MAVGLVESTAGVVADKHVVSERPVGTGAAAAANDGVRPHKGRAKAATELTSKQAEKIIFILVILV